MEKCLVVREKKSGWKKVFAQIKMLEKHWNVQLFDIHVLVYVCVYVCMDGILFLSSLGGMFGLAKKI